MDTDYLLLTKAQLETEVLRLHAKTVKLSQQKIEHIVQRDTRIRELEAQLAARDVEIATLKARIIDKSKQATAFPRDGKISIPPIDIPETWREKYIEEE